MPLEKPFDFLKDPCHSTRRSWPTSLSPRGLHNVGPEWSTAKDHRVGAREHCRFQLAQRQRMANLPALTPGLDAAPVQGIRRFFIR